MSPIDATKRRLYLVSSNPGPTSPERPEWSIGKVLWNKTRLEIVFKKEIDLAIFRASYLIKSEKPLSDGVFESLWTEPLNCLHLVDENDELISGLSGNFGNRMKILLTGHELFKGCSLQIFQIRRGMKYGMIFKL